MNPSRDFDTSSNGYPPRFASALERDAAAARAGIARAAGIVDVMGGIGEDAGSLVLTAATGLGIHAAVWPVETNTIRVVIVTERTDIKPAEIAIPSASLVGGETADLLRSCDKAKWAAPVLLSLRRAVQGGVLPAPASGLEVIIEHDFPDGADLGHIPATASAVASAYARSLGIDADHRALAASSAAAVCDLTGLHQLRKTTAALCEPSRRAILQMRFHPQLLCDPLELPGNVIIKALSTRLTRPTTVQRLIETRVCSDMGHRIIQELQRQDGQRLDPAQTRLSSITPTEYVERYRDRMPSKITQQQFNARFGAVRGLDEVTTNPKEVFKIRSRAEHHIYENRRVHDFATHIVRAKRNGSLDALVAAGELMYASHWSHSQRCGIGGVETDRLVSFIREAGPTAGLYGAKVTAGGEGGELVVLMRDDERAHAALVEAAAKAETASKQAVHLFEPVRADLRETKPADYPRSPATAGAV